MTPVGEQKEKSAISFKQSIPNSLWMTSCYEVRDEALLPGNNKSPDDKCLPNLKGDRLDRKNNGNVSHPVRELQVCGQK